MFRTIIKKKCRTYLGFVCLQPISYVNIYKAGFFKEHDMSHYVWSTKSRACQPSYIKKYTVGLAPPSQTSNKNHAMRWMIGECQKLGRWLHFRVLICSAFCDQGVADVREWACVSGVEVRRRVDWVATCLCHSGSEARWMEVAKHLLGLCGVWCAGFPSGNKSGGPRSVGTMRVGAAMTLAWTAEIQIKAVFCTKLWQCNRHQDRLREIEDSRGAQKILKNLNLS